MGEKGKECEGEKVIEVLEKYTDISVDTPGKVKGFLDHIEVILEKPTVQKTYLVSFNKREVMQKEIERMLK